MPSTKPQRMDERMIVIGDVVRLADILLAIHCALWRYCDHLRGQLFDNVR